MPTIYVDHPLVRGIDLLEQPAPGADRDQLNFDYLSASQIKLFRTCGIAYYLRYAKGLTSPPAAGMIKGTGTHAGVGAFWIGQVSRAPITIEQAVEIGKSAAAAEIATTTIDPDTTADVLRDVERGVRFLLEHEDNRRLKPLAVERGIVIHWKDPSVLPIAGFPDILVQEGAPMVIDWKTSTKIKSQLAADVDIGLTTYATGYRLIQKLVSMVVELRTVTFTKELKLQILPSIRTEEDTSILFNVCRVMTEQLQRGYYMPALDSDNFQACSGCAVRKECRELITRTAHG